MSGLRIDAYTPADRTVWDRFVRDSKNATFLFYRDYMDYHADRFPDASYLIHDGSTPVALLPATRRTPDTLESHAGLTYGGILCTDAMHTDRMVEIFGRLRDTLGRAGIRHWHYKAIPHIYHRRPAEEDSYALFRHGARLQRREVSASINLRLDEMPGKKRGGSRRAREHGLRMRDTADCRALMRVIDDNLVQRHRCHAVHTADEMNGLRARLPRHIFFHELVTAGTEVVGGAVVYLANRVAHAQYLCVTDSARRQRGMDLIIDALIACYRPVAEWFDFGISTEQGGQSLNVPLMRHKEEYGASAVCYDTWAIDTGGAA
jgi:hypothetical protein